MSPKLRVFLVVASVTFALDQGSKQLVVDAFGTTDRWGHMVIDGFFYITYVLNTGAAFSFGAEWNDTFKSIFFPVMGVVTLGIFYLLLTMASQRVFAHLERRFNKGMSINNASSGRV